MKEILDIPVNPQQGIIIKDVCYIIMQIIKKI